MDKKKRLAYLKEIDAHVGFHTGNGIAPQIPIEISPVLRDLIAVIFCY